MKYQYYKRDILSVLNNGISRDDRFLLENSITKCKIRKYLKKYDLWCSFTHSTVLKNNMVMSAFIRNRNFQLHGKRG